MVTFLRILLITAIIAVFFKKRKIKKNKTTINGKTTIANIELFIASLKLNFTQGKEAIINILTINYPNFDSHFINQIELEKLKTEFIKQLTSTLTKQPVNCNIQSLDFIFFERESSLFFLVSVSKYSPKENSKIRIENPIYLSKNRKKLPFFKNIYTEFSLYKGNISDVEQIIINGLLYLLIYNSIDEIENLTGNQKLNIGVEFETGDCYLIRE